MDAQRQVEFVVNGVDMPELFEEHRPLHVPELPVRRLDVGMGVPNRLFENCDILVLSFYRSRLKKAATASEQHPTTRGRGTGFKLKTNQQLDSVSFSHFQLKNDKNSD